MSDSINYEAIAEKIADLSEDAQIDMDALHDPLPSQDTGETMKMLMEIEKAREQIQNLLTGEHAFRDLRLSVEMEDSAAKLAAGMIAEAAARIGLRTYKTLIQDRKLSWNESLMLGVSAGMAADILIKRLMKRSGLDTTPPSAPDPA